MVDTAGDAGAAHKQLHAVDAAEMSLDELESLADGCFWYCELRNSLDARRRAYAHHRTSGNHPRAAHTCWLMFTGHLDLNEMSVARSWAARAVEHAAAEPDAPEAGYAALAMADLELCNQRNPEAIQHVDEAIAHARQHNDADLGALGRAVKARILVASGRSAEGGDELDSAMLAAVEGELTRLTTGRVYCLLVSTCHEVGDLRRAGEWTATALAWCNQLGDDSMYPGLCRLHRCELEALRGKWGHAESEAQVAVDELAPFGDYWVGEGLYLVGEIRRRRGDLTGAESAYTDAHSHGREPVPGISLLRAAQGDPIGATKALGRALAGGGTTPLRRANMLAAHVEVALQCDDLDAARESAESLATHAEREGLPLLRALADRAQGAILVAQGRSDEALVRLKQACAGFREVACPYEEAHVRVLMGHAAQALGDDDTAQLDYRTALSLFERLGATLDVENTRGLLPTPGDYPKGLTEREVEVLGLVARGMSNRDIAAALVISEHTVARHLSKAFRKLDVTSRSAAAAFAFANDLT